MSDWRPYEPCRENEVRASFAQFVLKAWPVVTDEPPPSPLMWIVFAAADRFDKRPLYRASCEARVELRGFRIDHVSIDDMADADLTLRG